MNPFIYQEDYPIVQTKEGALRGYEWKGTCIFKGIPYAHAQRFRKPERVKPWDGVKDVQSYGYVSPLLHPEQPGGNGEMMVPHMYWPEKEDCQNLNIWTPSIRMAGNVRLWYGCTAADFQQGLPSNSSPMTEKI